MAQIFCQSKAYRDINLFTFTELSEDQALEKFIEYRWGGRNSIICPFCNERGQHYYRKHRRQWRCKKCDAIFSVTTGTILDRRRLPLRTLLVAMFIFVASPKSEAANKSHAMLGVTLRTIFILHGKLRESLYEQRDITPLRGIVHIDGGHFCGKPRRPNVRKRITSAIVNSRLRNRKAGIIPPRRGDSIEPWNAEKLKNRRVVVVMREVSPMRGVGATKTRIVIVESESSQHVLGPIRTYVDKDAFVLMTDFSSAYTKLGKWFNHKAVNHSEEYSRDEVNQNQAESFMSRMRRSEFGVLHGMRPKYCALYANEFAWREDMRFSTLNQKFQALLKAVFGSGLSKVWRGYNQGHRLAGEYDGMPNYPERL
ncbi:MAG TPA: IS1595 family transposase [Herbaspirillum sp.]|uniref:IS1595 family transposase n=1 Tax=Herbaspirillum sp. TaxID=1890675 RepID=UPI002D4F48C7|nr:IS1595 family transposase [Herbaspirillum sp.]HZG18616.1 IS1595 family transposase [Herbaspirillum sp.]